MGGDAVVLARVRIARAPQIGEAGALLAIGARMGKANEVSLRLPRGRARVG